MSLNKYTLKVSRPEYWQEIHDLLTSETHVANIPDRCACCSDEKVHSPSRSTYELTQEEVEELANDYRIAWIELSPQDNPDAYPLPSHHGLPPEKRNAGNVKYYRTLTGVGYTAGEENRSNWGVRRTGLSTSQITTTGSQLARTDNVDYVYDGSNVDIIIHDSGVMASHPEFLNDDGTTRVKDVLLDGPYYIDPTFFDNGGYTYTKADGTVGIATESAHEWWRNTNYRSPAFSGIATINTPTTTYTALRSIGIGTGTTLSLTSGHGTAAASVAAGKNFGLAFKANIWNMPAISDNVGMGIEMSYDLMKIFHQNKPVNSSTGVKNPTVVNGSWGYQAAARNSQYHYTRFRGSDRYLLMNGSYSTYPADARTMVRGFNNQVSGAYRSWSSSSRSNSTDEAGKELMDAGVIYVAAAGNNDQYVGVGSTNPHRLNACEDRWFAVGDPRTEFTNYGNDLCPTSHRDWMNPQGIGFDATVDPEFHPVINVGAIDDYPVWASNLGIEEQKAYYSNKGDGIDIYAPADDMLAAGSPTSGYQDYLIWDTSAKYGASFYDAYFNGTSAASPVVAGLVACYMQRFPTADSRQVKEWLRSAGSNSVTSGGSQEPGTTFWDPYYDGYYTNNYYNYGDEYYLFWTYNRAMCQSPEYPIKVAYLNPQLGIRTDLGGINTPGISTDNLPERGVFNAGVALTSTDYDPIGGIVESGSLKKVHFQVSPSPEFTTIAWETSTDDTRLTQLTGALSQSTDYYFRVRHLSNPDGSSFTAYESEYSGVTSFRTYNPPQGISTPEVYYPTNGLILDSVYGIQLRSKEYDPINGEETSGTLKAVEFQVLSSLGTQGTGSSPQSFGVTITGAQQGGYSGDYYIITAVDRNGNVNGNDPSLTYDVGDTITFDLSVLGGAHPLYIRTTLGGMSAGGVSGEGTDTVTWNTTGLAAGTYYYQCGVHPNMFGVITLRASGSTPDVVVWESTGDNNTSLFQTVEIPLEYGTNYYARVRHISNSDGTAQAEFTSEYSAAVLFTTPAEVGNPYGRIASTKTSLQNGVVSPVLLFEASDLLDVTVTASNTSNTNSSFSIGISSDYGFKDSDYISYGIDLPRGGNDMLENITLKAGDKIYVSSFDPGVDFAAFSTKFYNNVSEDTKLVHGRSKSLTSGFTPPNTINDNLAIYTAKQNSIVTVHATNRNTDRSVAIGVGIASGPASSALDSDYIVFGQRVQPLQDFRMDHIGVGTDQTVFVRAAKAGVSFVAYSKPADEGPSGIGTVGDVNTTGVVTATKFVGDGSGLTGVTAVGSGIEVRDSGVAVGAASTVDFGDRISVSPISAGVVTVTSADTVSIAQTANSLANGVVVANATNAQTAQQAVNATQADYAVTSGIATIALSASIASGLRTDVQIFTTRSIETTDKFIGDGSLLQNVVALGSGVGIATTGGTVGTAQTVTLSTSLDVTPISAGIVTVSVQKVPHADIAGVATYASIAGVSSFCPNAGFATASTNASFAAFANFSALTGAAETSKSLYTESELPFKPLPVTFGTKSSKHRYTGVGSDGTINIQGYEAPYLRFEVGQTYRFENAAQQANFPIRFYYAADGLGVGFGTTSPSVYTDRVTETSTYTEIQITEETPQILYYGAGIGSTMGSMGNSIQVFNPEFHKFLRVGEYKNLAGLKTCTHTQVFEGRATAWYMNTNLGVGNSDYVPGDRSHNVSSIEQVSTGVYTVNFADAMNDVNYAVVINGRGTNNFPGGLVDATVYDRTTTGFGVTIYNSIPAPEDLRDVNIVVYGGQDGEPTYL